jgi:hypothetical protein
MKQDGGNGPDASNEERPTRRATPCRNGAGAPARPGGAAIAEPPADGIDKRLLLKTLTAFKKGDLSARMPVDRTGIAGKIADTLNEVIEVNESLAAELERVGLAVGREGRLSERASLAGAKGSWKACVGSVA